VTEWLASNGSARRRGYFWGEVVNLVRVVMLAVVALLPNFVKCALLRLFGHRIGHGVRIGLSILDARHLDLARRPVGDGSACTDRHAEHHSRW
jgi:hypothetical protein